ncbi:NAD-dependent epimerase/dehydratase family protein [Patescibacteria group bacterium]|nr:MAG: NAD-dependent epimerase/dehydratase family protein [Patescibacteria group bacterium]
MSHLTGQNIFVTGGAGLVGAHLVSRLLALKPAKIVCLCRSRDPLSLFYSEKLDEQVVCSYGDLKDKERMFDLISKHEINYIFHVAAQPIVPTAYVNPYETLDTNIMGTVNILEAARLSPSTRAVIVASSDKAYGKHCLLAEENQALAGDHPYDASKSCADLLAQTYAKTYGLPATVSRFGNIYGPGDLNFNRIIPGIMKAALENSVLQIRSDGHFKRDYVYAPDVVDGYLCLAENIAAARGEAFNFSSGQNFSVLDLVAKISDIIGVKIKHEILNNQKNEIPEQSLNFEKAAKVLGWQSRYPFAEGIKETFAWYQNKINNKKYMPLGI